MEASNINNKHLDNRGRTFYNKISGGTGDDPEDVVMKMGSVKYRMKNNVRKS